MKKLGLALGGGAVLGAAHVGVLKAIIELDLEISYIAGTSIGAFVAAFYAFGKIPAEIEEIALNHTWLDISGIFLFKNGLQSNEKLCNLILEHIGDEKIENAEIPLALIATDISTGKKVVLKEGNVAKGIMARTCLLSMFIPVELNDITLVEGGIVENVPVDTIKEMGADYVIGVDLNAKNKYKKSSNIIEVFMNSLYFTLKAAAKYQAENADLLIMPDLSKFNMSDTSQVKELIKQGYKDSKKLLEENLA